jgi:hypothetical protein
MWRSMEIRHFPSLLYPPASAISYSVKRHSSGRARRITEVSRTGNQFRSPLYNPPVELLFYFNLSLQVFLILEIIVVIVLLSSQHFHHLTTSLSVDHSMFKKYPRLYHFSKQLLLSLYISGLCSQTASLSTTT